MGYSTRTASQVSKPSPQGPHACSPATACHYASNIHPATPVVFAVPLGLVAVCLICCRADCRIRVETGIAIQWLCLWIASRGVDAPLLLHELLGGSRSVMLPTVRTDSRHWFGPQAADRIDDGDEALAGEPCVDQARYTVVRSNESAETVDYTHKVAIKGWVA